MKFLICSFLLVASLLIVSADHHQQKDYAPIVKQAYDIGADGTYEWHYETGDGIKAIEHGSLKQTGQKEEALAVEGSVGWTDKEGQHYELTYTADENGFQPQGAHLPTPPPVPEAILRSLEFIKNHPYTEEKSSKPYQSGRH